MRNIHGVFRKIYNFRGAGAWGEHSDPPKMYYYSPIEEEEELFDEWAPGHMQATPERPNITRTPSPLVWEEESVTRSQSALWADV